VKGVFATLTDAAGATRLAVDLSVAREGLKSLL